MSKIDLIQGDCFEKIKTIQSKSIDLIITDPPYKMQNGQKGNTALGKRLQQRRNDLKEKRLIDFGEEQIKQIAEEIKRVSKKINCFIFCSKDQIRHWYNAFPSINPYILFWGKTNPPPTFKNSLLPDVEYILWFRENGVKMYNNYQNSSRFDITAINQKDKKLYNHPTIKPIEIIKRYITIASKEDDTVLDMFMGSGSTGVACRDTNRNFIGIELDEQYFNIAKKRIEETKTQQSIFDYI